MSEPPRSIPPPRPFVSIGTRLAVPVAVLVLLVAASAHWALVRTSWAAAIRSKEEAADMVVKLTSASVGPAVVFGDDVEIKRAVSDLAKNAQVTDVELWSAEADRASLADFHRGGGAGSTKPTSLLASRSREQASITATEPVRAPDGKVVALLVARFSTDREKAALDALSRQLLWASLGTALLLAASISWFQRRVVTLPLRGLQRAARDLASGQSAVTEAKGMSRLDDEVMQLTSSFREMALAVRDREYRLGVRNNELRLILDNVEQGFLSLMPDGSLQAERSAVLDVWLGPLPTPCHLWELVARVDASLGAWTRSAWEQVMDGFIPLEVALDQLPKRAVRGTTHFDFAYHPVFQGQQLEQVVVVVTDVSAEVARQRADEEQREFSGLVQRFISDRRGFNDFWSEAASLVAHISAPEAAGERLRRELHTLKGNARFFALRRLSATCHFLEDRLQGQAAAALTPEERLHLRDTWQALDDRVRPLIQGVTPFVEISEEEYVRVVRALEAHAPHAALLELIRGLRDEPTERRLLRAKEAVLQVCERLGKSAPDVQVEHNGLRLPSERFAPFWSVLQHVLSNAADHGIETDEERAQAGKSLPAQVRLSTRLQGRELWVEVADDGRGIDWSQVRTKAAELGLPSATERDLEHALLADGFTLAHEVSEVSGRGVGLAAVRSVLSALGGAIELKSARGHGARWRFRFDARILEGDDATRRQSVLGRRGASPTTA